MRRGATGRANVTSHRACRSAKEAAAARSPLAAPARPPRRPRLRVPGPTTLAALPDTRRPGADPAACPSGTAGRGSNPQRPEGLGTAGSTAPAGSSRARRGCRGVGARAPARAAVTPSSPRAPALPPTHPPLTVDVPQGQLVAQLRERLHGLQTAQLSVPVHRPARCRGTPAVPLRETRGRCRRHRP